MSRVVGCDIDVLYPTDHADGFHFARLILAAVECLLATGFNHNMISFLSDLSIRVNLHDHDATTLSFNRTYRSGVPEFAVSVTQNASADAGELSHFRQGLAGLLLAILAEIAGQSAAVDSVKALLTDENALDRSVYFPAPITPRPSFPLPLSQLTVGTYEPLQPATQFGRADTRRSDTNLSHHQELRNVGLIRNEVWDRAGWNGCVYLSTTKPGSVPTMGLIFSSEQAGRDVFDTLIEQIGTDNVEGKLSVTFTLADDSHDYLATIQSNVADNSDDNLVLVTSRNLTMTPATRDTLDWFLQLVDDASNTFLLAPAFVSTNDGPLPILDLAITVKRSAPLHQTDSPSTT